MPTDDPIAAHHERMNALALEAWQRATELPGSYMVDTSQMIQSKYLAKGDVFTPLVLTIRGLSLESFGGGGRGGGDDQRWVLYFNEHPKGLKLNNTNIRLLEAGFGSNADAWAGQRVQVYNDPTVTMAGQVVGGVRIRCPKRTTAQLIPGAAGQRFDPMTGQPIAPAGARFDPITGAPLTPTALPAGAPAAAGGDPEFDDDVPF